MNFIDEIIPEQGIINYIDEYKEDNHPDDIFKLLVRNIEMKKMVDTTKGKIHYKLTFGSHETIITGKYNVMIAKLLKFQILYDFLFMWATIRKAKKCDEMDTQGINAYTFFYTIFEEELGLSNTELESLSTKVFNYFF